tara:strand:+ start:5002 stop:6330 length:1329 start_codon:yes stop_codon:yes gene_type:complete
MQGLITNPNLLKLNDRDLNLVNFERFRLLLQPALLRLCVTISIVTAIVMLLSSFAILASLTSISTPLLLITIAFWVVYFVLLSFLNDSHKQLRSLQSTGGDILQLATSYALRDIGDLPVFTKGERALEGDDYSIAAQEFAALADKGIPAGAVNEVVALIRSAHFSAARDALQRGLKQNHKGSRILRAALWNNLGVIEARQGRPNEAQISYKRAIEIFRSESDRRGSGDALINGANASANRGDFIEAIKQLDESDRSYPRQRSSLSLASRLACKGYIESESSDDDERSLDLLNKSLSLFVGANCNIGRAYVLMLRGNIFFKCEKMEDALSDYSEASLLSSDIGDPLGEASARVNIGNVRFRQGDHESALEDYQSALSVHESLENVLGQARTRTNIGSVLVRLGNTEEALESLLRARELYASIKAQGRLVDTVEQVISQIEENR